MQRKITDDSLDQAQRALRVFRSLQPTLNAYARYLTGRRDVRVEADPNSNGSTNGKTIFYRPPISLGERVQHKPWKCNRRYENSILVCPACRQRESVLVTIYHEIAHIWFGSFTPMTDAAKAKTILQAIEANGTKYGEAVREMIGRRGAHLAYMELARAVSPFFPMLLNCLEDARVNRELFKAMAGTKIMFDADTAAIFDKGVEHLDETGNWTHTHWRDRPLNMQALIGVFCMASGYNFSTWLNEFVVKSLADAKLVGLIDEINKLDTNASIDATFSLAFPVLARLRELGFCRDEEDPEDDFVPPYEEESEAPEPDEESEDDGDTEESAPTGAGEPAAGYEEDTGDGDDSARSDDDGDSGGSEPGDGADGAADDEESVNDDSAGGDQPGECASGPEGDDETPGGEAGESGTGSVDSDSGSDGEDGSDEVLEEDPGSGTAGAVESSGAGSAGDLRDDEGPGGALDGSDREVGGDEDGGESGDSADDSGDSLVETDHDGSDGDLVGGAELDTDDVEPIDLKGGERSIRVEGEEKPPVKPKDIDWGTADDIAPEVLDVGGHDLPDHVHADAHTAGIPHEHSPDEAGDEAVKQVLLSGIYFEKPSVYVAGVNIRTEANGAFAAWEELDEVTRKRYGFEGKIEPEERTIGPALLRARVVFAENYRGKHDVGLRRGRVHSPSLGRRAPVGDDRVFQRKTRPGRVDYFVGIGIDCSGSTAGVNIDLAKQVAYAEAEVLHRLGIPFFMYGHTGTWGYAGAGMELEMIEIKTSQEPWGDATRSRLKRLGPRAANLDGHTIQFYRKMLEKERATKKIMHYYSDGSMPCENYEEELTILRDEIQRYKRAGIILPCVGIRTNAPMQHGLHTVEVREQADVLAVVNDLEKHLTQN